MKGNKFFKSDEVSKIISAIEKAETHTSGEIRVHVESLCTEDVLDRAAWIFKKLKMSETKERNGVLVYLAMKSKKFAIIGDVGINMKVEPDFWEQTKEKMHDFFAKSEYAQGIEYGILEAGKRLSSYFPYDEHTDTNELSNDISIGE